MKKAFFILALVILASNFNFGQTMSAPVNVSKSPDNNSKWAQCAMGPNGEVHIAWVEEYPGASGNDIYYVKYDGVTAPNIVKIKNSPGVPADRLGIACNPKGVVAVVWNQENMGVFMREYDPTTKAWKPIVQVSDEPHEGYEQNVAIDPDGNIFTIFYSKRMGIMWSRARINGKWESLIRLSGPSFSTHNAIVAGEDGKVWAIFREKRPPYSVYYSTRTKSTPWTAKKIVKKSGSSQAHPGITVGPDNIGYVTYAAGLTDEEGPLLVYMLKLLGADDENPKEEAMPLYVQHYPRPAIDIHGNKHVAAQIGSGDNGSGIRYTNNIGGSWKPPVVMPYSGGFTKLPGISADSYGNVALVWAAAGEAWLSTLYPLAPKKMHPPANLAGNISIASGSSITYNLSWQANPSNVTDSVKYYHIYKKDSANDDWENLLTVNKSTLSASFTYSQFNPTLQFAISSESGYGVESEKATFEVAIPTPLAPLNLGVNLSVAFSKGSSDVTYRLNWQSNPQNIASFIQGYRIYRKEGTGDYTPVATLPKTTFSASYSFTNLRQRVQFGITTVSIVGQESPMVVFGVQ